MAALTNEELLTANEIWDAYARSHDLSGKLGGTAGIDPDSESVFLGNSIQDVVQQSRRAGIDRPLLFKRIGTETYYIKGSKRC